MFSTRAPAHEQGLPGDPIRVRVFADEFLGWLWQEFDGTWTTMRTRGRVDTGWTTGLAAAYHLQGRNPADIAGVS